MNREAPKPDQEKGYAQALRQMTLRYERLVQALSILRRLDDLDTPGIREEEVVARILETIAVGLAAENCSLLMVDESGGHLELRGACGPFDERAQAYAPGAWKASRFRMGEGVVGAVAVSGEPRCIADVARDDAFVPMIHSHVTIRSLLCFPLWVDEQVIGVLNLSHSEPGFFSKETERILELIARRAARMFANALLHEEVRRQEQHYQLVAANAGDAILVAGRTGEVVSWNAAAAAIAGCAPERIEKEDFDWTGFVAEEDRDAFRAHVQGVFAENAPDTLEYRLVNACREVHHLEQRTAPMVDRSGNVTGAVCVARDVTDRKAAEAELRLYRERLEELVAKRTEELLRAQQDRLRLATAVEQAAESILIADMDGRVQYCNPTAEQISGYAAEEVVGQAPMLPQRTAGSVRAYADVLAAVRRGDPWVGRWSSVRKDGRPLEEEVTISPVRNEAGAVENFVVVKRDITAEVEMERRLRQAEKLEAVGQLASGVAHDFNNLLQGIQGYAYLALEHMPQESGAARQLGEVVKAADQAAQLTRQLLAFSRQDAVEMLPADLNGVVQETADMIRRLIGDPIELVLELAEELPLIRADRGQLSQVLVNLCINARDAMPEGGALTLSTGTGRGPLDPEGGETNRNWVYLAVRDSGSGMPPEVRARIFEPFFTTKEQGKGTGLGLSTVYGIAQHHGGEVEVMSAEGEGSVFTVWLLAGGLSAVEETPVEPVARQKGGRGTILVAEDEEMVRHFITEVLEEAGYDVVAACDGQEAVACLEAGRKQFAMAVLDVSMPRMGGEEACGRLRELDPELPILLTTAHHAPMMDPAYLDRLEVRGMMKPYSPPALLAKIAEMLDGNPPARGARSS